jgi:hypothetical protein
LATLVRCMTVLITHQGAEWCHVLPCIRVAITQDLAHWKKMVTTQEFAEKMNALDPTTTVLEPVGGDADKVVQDGIIEEDNKEKEGDTPDQIPGENQGVTLPGIETAENEIPELVDQEDK